MSNFDDLSKYEEAGRASSLMLKLKEQEVNLLAEKILKEFAQSAYGKNSFFVTNWQYTKPFTPISYPKQNSDSILSGLAAVVSNQIEIGTGKLPWHLILGASRGKGHGYFFIGVYPKIDKIKLTVGWCPHIKFIFQQHADPGLFEGQVEIEDPLSEVEIATALKFMYKTAIESVNR